MAEEVKRDTVSSSSSGTLAESSNGSPPDLLIRCYTKRKETAQVEAPGATAHPLLLPAYSDFSWLLLLLDHEGGYLDRETLLNLFRAEKKLKDRETAQAQIREALRTLREKLSQGFVTDADGGQTGSEHFYVPGTRDEVELKHIRSDATIFLGYLREAESARTDEERLRHLEVAVRAYEENVGNGEYLNGYTWPWIEDARKELEKKHTHAVTEKEKLEASIKDRRDLGKPRQPTELPVTSVVIAPKRPSWAYWVGGIIAVVVCLLVWAAWRKGPASAASTSAVPVTRAYGATASGSASASKHDTSARNWSALADMAAKRGDYAEAGRRSQKAVSEWEKAGDAPRADAARFAYADYQEKAKAKRGIPAREPTQAEIELLKSPSLSE